MEVVLGGQERVAGNVAVGSHLWTLSLLLLASGVLFAVPFGAVPPVAGFWKIAALYTGSVVLCFPSLHVFASFLGLSLSLAQNLVLALLVSAVAAAFAFGFFPIVWFIDYTTESASSVIEPMGIARFVLMFSQLMGIVQLGRCLLRSRKDSASGTPLQLGLFGCWILLLVFITNRMAALVGLD
jgi:hypothetical protein